MIAGFWRHMADSAKRRVIWLVPQCWLLWWCSGMVTEDLVHPLWNVAFAAATLILSMVVLRTIEWVWRIFDEIDDARRTVDSWRKR